jgi:hypothetical protein
MLDSKPFDKTHPLRPSSGNRTASSSSRGMWSVGP